ncbi:aminotransferase class I/II-fold pyridoxal phosphate-dependent enzyme [Streptomyces sp. NPDC079020]|uniref:aminotransferase class I/II-fold pyridoxal phosphate-dependent enzyme n=1 Tax=Streptomyces sp. NPDC079020 TaxID=3365722 RepID=UPI0037CDC5D8
MWCFEQRPGLRCVPARLDGADQLTLTVDALKRAYDNSPDPKPKLLVLTNPHNPLGVNYDKKLLEDVCRWALDKQMHIVSDEIYAHSQSTGTDGFRSVLSLDAYATDPARFHLVYGLTKDFGLSGFRIGFLVSKSNAVRKVMQGDETWKSLAWFGPLDSLKSAYVRRLFGTTAQPSDFPATLMEDYRKSLKDAFDRAAATFRSNKIKYVGQDEQSRNAAQFFLLDLSAYLDSKKFPEGLEPLHHEIDPREARLEAYLRTDAKVLLLPGGEMHCPRRDSSGCATPPTHPTTSTRRSPTSRHHSRSSEPLARRRTRWWWWWSPPPPRAAPPPPQTLRKPASLNTGRTESVCLHGCTTWTGLR